MSETTVSICRFCLCKCHEPINMLIEGSFTQKVLDVFYKLRLEVVISHRFVPIKFLKVRISFQISPENQLPVILCRYCYNTIDQFHLYFTAVAENQVKLEELLHERAAVDEIKIEQESHDEGARDAEVGNYIEVSGKPSPIVQKRSKRYAISTYMVRRYKEGLPLEPALKAKLAKNYNKLYICHYCDYYTFHKPRLVNHVLECKDSSCSPPSQISYKTVPDKDLLVVPCPLCPPDALKMKNEKILQLHLKEHADFDRIDRDRIERGCQPLIPCPRCERRLRSQAEFLTHMKKHENDEFMTCELCGRTTVTTNLRSHLRNHFKKIICEFCSKVFKNPSGLQRHIVSKHSGPEFYLCEKCNRKIRRKKKFKEHLAVCRGPGTIWPCIHCGEKFESNSHRHYHVKKFHIGYKCKMCSIEVKSVTQLKHHYKSEAHKQRAQEKRAEIAQSKLVKVSDVATLKRR